MRILSDDYSECGEQIELEALNKGGFDRFAFYNAFHSYQNSGIDDSLQFDRNDSVIYENTPEVFTMIDESNAYKMTTILESVVTNGSGKAADRDRKSVV